MDSLCSKTAPKIIVFLYGFLLDGIGGLCDCFSFVKKANINETCEYI
jgi:hypothetical protein